ncbi:hypothetical protein BC835DRAFT_289249 [Cytidiella melzeri]|nr:hypothetical protein BC835DRAFT_289249 [Cytidiella melzeri]
MEEFCAVNTQFAMNVMIGSFVINAFSEFVKPTVGNIFTTVSGHQRKIVKFVGPNIEERKPKPAECGPDYPDKPRPTESPLFLRELGSENVDHELCHIAYNHHVVCAYLITSQTCLNTRSCVERKCKHILALTSQDGPSHGLGALSLPQKAMRTYTSRDGTVVPKGAILSATQTAVHYDSSYYPKANEFDRFRFNNQPIHAAGEKGGEEEVGEENKEEDWRYRLTGTGRVSRIWRRTSCLPTQVLRCARAKVRDGIGPPGVRR